MWRRSYDKGPPGGETLKEYNLHMMPTLMSDTQMVLPIEKL